MYEHITGSRAYIIIELAIIKVYLKNDPNTVCTYFTPSMFPVEVCLNYPHPAVCLGATFLCSTFDSASSTSIHLHPASLVWHRRSVPDTHRTEYSTRYLSIAIDDARDKQQQQQQLAGVCVYTRSTIICLCRRTTGTKYYNIFQKGRR